MTSSQWAKKIEKKRKKGKKSVNALCNFEEASSERKEIF